MEEEVKRALTKVKQCIERREETYDLRSQGWKETIKGERYKLQTEVLKTISQELESVQDSLIDWEENN